MSKISLALLSPLQITFLLISCKPSVKPIFITYFGGTAKADDGISISPTIEKDNMKFNITVQGIDKCCEGVEILYFKFVSFPVWHGTFNSDINNEDLILSFDGEKVDWGSEHTRNGTYTINYSNLPENYVSCIEKDTFFIYFLSEFKIYPSETTRKEWA